MTVARGQALQAAVIINPIAGRGRPGAARRAELAGSAMARRRLAARVWITERPGHARELARTAVAEGAALVVAWGGDGTVNEVASELAFGSAALGIVPAGSGNGLARELGIPFDPEAALAVACEGRLRTIDAGELDGRLFFNVAGIGLDARVARTFAHGGRRRGPARYVAAVARELLACRRADEHTLRVDHVSIRIRPLLIAVANGRQYGNGAVIAPDALLDDGRLDVVVVEERPPWIAALQAPKLFAGGIRGVPGVTVAKATDLEVCAPRPIVYHVDGEPGVGERWVRGRVHPRALRVRVPASLTTAR